MLIIIIIIVIVIRAVLGNARLGESDRQTPNQSEDPSHMKQTNREKEEAEKRVEDKKEDDLLRPTIKHWSCS